jgi:hypothetical protein
MAVQLAPSYIHTFSYFLLIALMPHISASCGQSFFSHYLSFQMFPASIVFVVSALVSAAQARMGQITFLYILTFGINIY